MGMRIVALQREILEAKSEQVLDLWIQSHRRQGAWRTRKLQPRLFQMIRVKMAITAGPHEVAEFEIEHLGNHHGQQRIRSDVEWHAEEDVGAALIELARELAVRDIKLEQGMARRQLHLRYISRVPR